MFRSLVFTLLIGLGAPAFGQHLEADKAHLESALAELDHQKSVLLDRLEQVQLNILQRDLLAVGLPSKQYILHSA
ncbi:MAG: hypothetical protein JNK89_08730, partial [Saprospiraceae bacterium]|nr:hypothetical protein [Saprospiraceae bacterium]